MHKTYEFTISIISNFNGWRVSVLLDDSQRNSLHVDSLDAAKAIAQITAAQYMEKYHARFNKNTHRRRFKAVEPPAFRPGVFKVG
jgi:hypothetical protein